MASLRDTNPERMAGLGSLGMSSTGMTTGSGRPSSSSHISQRARALKVGGSSSAVQWSVSSSAVRMGMPASGGVVMPLTESKSADR